MSDAGERGRRDDSRRVRPWHILLGALIFGVVNFLVNLWAFGRSLAYDSPYSLQAGLVYLAIIAVISAAVFLLGARSLAAGIAAGYVILTLVSGGQCTLFSLP